MHLRLRPSSTNINQCGNNEDGSNQGGSTIGAAIKAAEIKHQCMAAAIK